jgi:outer membrane protein OmpA-like peptidoglycan-associated protein
MRNNLFLGAVATVLVTVPVACARRDSPTSDRPQAAPSSISTSFVEPGLVSKPTTPKTTTPTPAIAKLTTTPASSTSRANVPDATGAVPIVAIAADTLFETDSATLTELSTEALSQLDPILISTARSTTVTGYTDHRGTPQANQALSQRRAESVVAWLVERGADPTRIRAIGRGDCCARASTVDEMAADRRVEIAIER